MSEAAVQTTEQSYHPAASSYSKVLARWNSIVSTFGEMPIDHLYSAFANTGTAWRNQPQINNARIKAINTLPADYTKEQLGKFLTAPQASELPLRQISQVLRWSAYPYNKIIKTYADILSYRHYVKPLYVDSSEVKTDDFKREWRLVDKVEKAFRVEEVGHEAAAQAGTLGKVYKIIRYDVDKSHNRVNYMFTQQLPQDWCMPIGFNNVSKYTISFNMMYFLQPGTDYRQFGDLFEPYINDFYAVVTPDNGKSKSGKKYIYATKTRVGAKTYTIDRDRIDPMGEGRPNVYEQNGKWFYYVSLPIDRVWTFEIDDSTAIVASPFSGLLQTFAQQADYEAAQLSLVVNPLIKVFTGEIPYRTPDGAATEDAMMLSYGARAMFEAFWNELMSATHTGGTAMYSAPFQNIKSHDFQESANANDVSSSFLSYGMSKTGLQALVPANDAPHQGVAEYSAKLESRFADRIYRTLERMFDYTVSTLNLAYEWKMTVFGSVYTDSLTRADALKQLDKGDVSQHFVLAALDDVSVLDRLSMSYAVKGSGLLDMLAPPATAYTMSNGGSGTQSKSVPKSDTGGAPEKDEAAIEETKQEKSVESEEAED